ncbi:hypothetical protein [Actinoplanes sp. NPDC051851]|uniref:Rv1733c family protein n=1 Tax=Actinoplanes sp. NPDC051851 TaxID=3154753 RepID=UPI00342A9F5F
MRGRPVARRLGWERNELRRTSDRLQGWMVFTLVMTFLAGAPLLAWWGGEAAYRADLRAQEWEREHSFPVQAVLVEDAGPVGAFGTRTEAPGAARATWTAPDGSPHSGLIQAASTARVGSRVAIWVDDTGSPRLPPGRHSPVTQAVVVGFAVVLCVASAVAGAHRVGTALLDRQRDRAWQREWLQVGPLWSRRDRR